MDYELSNQEAVVVFEDYFDHMAEEDETPIEEGME